VARYAIYAQTFKDLRARAINGEPATRVEYHLVDLVPPVTGGQRSICGEIVDYRRKPQSVQRWETLKDSMCKNCERLAGEAARQQAEREQAESARTHRDSEG
jgi:hypothetical protein